MQHLMLSGIISASGGGGGGGYTTTAKLLQHSSGNYYNLDPYGFGTTDGPAVSVVMFLNLPVLASNVNIWNYWWTTRIKLYTNSPWIASPSSSTHNQLYFTWMDIGGTQNFYSQSNWAQHGVAADQWFPICYSMDMTGPTRHAYVNNVSVGASGVSSANCEINRADHLIFGADDVGNGPADNVAISHVWMAAEYINFSVEANRAKFYDTTTLKPVDLGADGSGPTGRQPEWFFPDGNANVNLGFRGNYAEIGTVPNAPTSPTD